MAERDGQWKRGAISICIRAALWCTLQRHLASSLTHADCLSLLGTYAYQLADTRTCCLQRFGLSVVCSTSPRQAVEMQAYIALGNCCGASAHTFCKAHAASRRLHDGVLAACLSFLARRF